MATSPITAHVDGVRLSVHLTPGAAHNRLDRLDQSASGATRLRATVTAAPEHDKANKALVKLLAGKLRLPKSAIQIIAGHHAREKTLLITGETANLIEQITAAFVIEEVMKL